MRAFGCHTPVDLKTKDYSFQRQQEAQRVQNKNNHVVQRRRILSNEPERTAEDSLLLDAVKTWRRGSGSASDDYSKWRCGRRRGEHPATTTDVGHGIDSLPRRKKENYQSI